MNSVLASLPQATWRIMCTTALVSANGLQGHFRAGQALLDALGIELGVDQGVGESKVGVTGHLIVVAHVGGEVDPVGHLFGAFVQKIRSAGEGHDGCVLVVRRAPEHAV